MKLRYRAVAVVLFTLCFGSAVRAADGPYPVEVAQWNDSVKQQQREAGTALMKKLNDAIAAGEKSFTIPGGNYRFDQLLNPTAWNASHLAIRNAQNMVIDAQGSTFWFEKQANGMVLENCRNTTLKNLKIDWDPLPFTQGTVQSIDPQSSSITVRLDPGYERVTSGFAVNSATQSEVVGSIFRGMLFDSKTRRFKTEQDGFRIEPFWGNKQPDGTYRVDIKPFSGKFSNVGVVPGDLIAMWARKGYGVMLMGCGEVKLERVSLYASPFICYSDAVGPGGNIYDHCQIVRRPGTNRLMAGNADGFNCNNNVRGPILDGCEIDTIGDDFVNVHGHLARILAQPDSTTLIVSRMNFRDQPGDDASIDIYERATMAPLGNAKIVASKMVSVKLEKETCLADLNTRWYSGEASSLVYGKTVRAQQLTLEKPVQLKPDSVVLCDRFNGRGTIIRNCNFSGSLARGVLVQGPDTLIENNVFQNIRGSVLEIGGSPSYWGEGGVVNDLRLIGNTFDSGSLKPVVRILPLGKGTQAAVQKNIEIKNNKFLSGWPAIQGDNAENVVIQNNRFPARPDNAQLKEPVIMNNSKNVHIAAGQ